MTSWSKMKLWQQLTLRDSVCDFAMIMSCLFLFLSALQRRLRSMLFKTFGFACSRAQEIELLKYLSDALGDLGKKSESISAETRSDNASSHRRHGERAALNGLLGLSFAAGACGHVGAQVFEFYRRRRLQIPA
jgi:hypothetical protein